MVWGGLALSGVVRGGLAVFGCFWSLLDMLRHSLKCSPLLALPVHLLRQVFFEVLFRCFFQGVFQVVKKVPKGGPGLPKWLPKVTQNHQKS